MKHHKKILFIRSVKVFVVAVRNVMFAVTARPRLWKQNEAASAVVLVKAHHSVLHEG